ncbi:MAG: hypothetical protein IJ055_08330 [Oscillospiraceae bacterium]|nr:hypothetical protein [Oscillospiraceae bacterium]
MKRSADLLLSVLLLLPGAGIYLTMNQDTELFRSLLGGYAIPVFSTGHALLDRLLICYGADFFWAASFVFAIQSIVQVPYTRAVLLMLCSVLGTVTEVLQKVHLFRGTYDVLDIVVFFMGTIFSVMIVYQRGRYYAIQTNAQGCRYPDNDRRISDDGRRKRFR